MLDLEPIVLTTSKEVHVYLYTKGQVIIPRLSSGVYGSVHKKFRLAENTTYVEKFYVRKNELRAIDRRSKRCANDPAHDTVGRCVVRYIENLAKCTSRQAMASDMKFCDRSRVSYASRNISHFRDMSEKEVFSETGCLPLCNRDEIQLESTDESIVHPAKSGHFVRFCLGFLRSYLCISFACG